MHRYTCAELMTGVSIPKTRMQVERCHGRGLKSGKRSMEYLLPFLVV
jgi:hypothetical protein